MKNQNLIVLGGVAVLLGLGAYFTSSGRRIATPSFAGRPVLDAFDPSAVAAVEIGEKLKLVAGAVGWEIATSGGYPADVSKIREQVLKLQELKVGQVARGRDLGEKTLVALKDAAGKTLASVALGDKHVAQPKGEMAMYGGGYPDGRYVSFRDQTVLVNDALSAFDGDLKSWVETKICDKPYVTFTELVDAAKEAECGFATGKVCRVEANGQTNLAARVGGTAPDGSGRYFKFDDQKWIYVISSYSAEQLTKEEAKPEVKTEAKSEVKPEVKPAEVKTEVKPEAKPEVKPAAK